MSLRFPIINCPFCRGREMKRAPWLEIYECACGHKQWPEFPQFRCDCEFCEIANARLSKFQDEPEPKASTPAKASEPAAKTQAGTC